MLCVTCLIVSDVLDGVSWKKYVILVNSSQGGDCWSFGVTLSAPMEYDDV